MKLTTKLNDGTRQAIFSGEGNPSEQFYDFANNCIIKLGQIEEILEESMLTDWDSTTGTYQVVLSEVKDEDFIGRLISWVEKAADKLGRLENIGG